MANILIKGGSIFDGECFTFADVLTDGNQIVKIGSDLLEQADFVYDAKGKIVSAGLVDTHTHMKHITSDDYGIPIDAVCLPFGVTAAIEASAIKGNREILDSLAVKTLIFSACTISDDTADFGITEKMLNIFGEKCIGIKVFFDTTNGGLKSIKPLREICEFACARKLKVMVHSSNSPTSMEEIVNTLSKGDILTHIYHGGNNTIDVNDYAAYRKARQKGVILDVGMAGHVHTDFGVLKRAIDAGCLPDTISTDITKASAYKRGGRYGMTMCMNIAKTLGMREEDIFRAVTSNPAKALGKEKEWGYLRVGRCADIAVFDYTDEGFDLTDHAGNHIRNSEGYRCVLTISDGQVVYRN